MTDTPTAKGAPVDRRTPEELTGLARRIMTNDLLITDPNDRDWQVSLMLLISAIDDMPENLGMILVPMGPHHGGRWLNGRVPAVTLEAVFVAVEDVEALGAECRRMWEALNPT